MIRATDCILLLEFPSMPIEPGLSALQEPMGAHVPTMRQAPVSDPALWFCSFSVQLVPRAPAGLWQTVTFPYSWAGRLCLLKARPPPGDRSPLQTSPRAEVALPMFSVTTLGTMIAGPHACLACAGCACSPHAGPCHCSHDRLSFHSPSPAA